MRNTPPPMSDIVVTEQYDDGTPQVVESTDGRWSYTRSGRKAADWVAVHKATGAFKWFPSLEAARRWTVRRESVAWCYGRAADYARGTIEAYS